MKVIKVTVCDTAETGDSFSYIHKVTFMVGVMSYIGTVSVFDMVKTRGGMFSSQKCYILQNVCSQVLSLRQFLTKTISQVRAEVRDRVQGEVLHRV